MDEKGPHANPTSDPREWSILLAEMRGRCHPETDVWENMVTIKSYAEGWSIEVSRGKALLAESLCENIGHAVCVVYLKWRGIEV